MATTHTPYKADPNRVASEWFAQCFRAYKECSDNVQAVIQDMVDVVYDPETTEDEREMALSTIAEALFPGPHDGIDLAEWDREEKELGSPDARAALRQMDEEEATFAERLAAVMESKGINQTELAEMVGVQQPAISQMLNRNCRPQRRTVLKLAEALGVKPEQLWPAVTP